MATCKSCNADIIFVPNLGSMKKSPLDAAPVDDGDIVIIHGAWRRANDEDRHLHRPLYKSHFATCSSADKHRSKR